MGPPRGLQESSQGLAQGLARIFPGTWRNPAMVSDGCGVLHGSRIHARLITFVHFDCMILGDFVLFFVYTIFRLGCVAGTAYRSRQRKLVRECMLVLCPAGDQQSIASQQRHRISE